MNLKILNWIEKKTSSTELYSTIHTVITDHLMWNIHVHTITLTNTYPCTLLHIHTYHTQRLSTIHWLLPFFTLTSRQVTRTWFRHDLRWKIRYDKKNTFFLSLYEKYKILPDSFDFTSGIWFIENERNTTQNFSCKVVIFNCY